MLFRNISSLKYIVPPAVIALLTLAVGCGGGFQSKPTPEIDDEILYKINPSVAVYGGGARSEPMAMPQPDANDDSVKQVPFAGEAPRDAVEPFGLTNAVTTFSDGQVQPVDLNVSPYTTMGRSEAVFPSTQPGYTSNCSAEFIGSSGVLLTAAHCVYDHDRNEWLNDVVFRWAYNNGSWKQSYGWQCAAIVSGWRNKRYAYDYAFIKVRGTPPAGLGLRLNVKQAHVDSVGYPKNFGSNSIPYHVTGNKDAGNPSTMTNAMREGSSGGAWFTDDHFAVSVNSYYNPPDTQYMHGPVISDLSNRLYNFVASGCTQQFAAPGEALSSTDEYAIKDANGGNQSQQSVTVLAVASKELVAGTHVELDTTQSCECPGAVNQVLVNSSTDQQLVAYDSIEVDGGQSSSSTEFVQLAPGQHLSLGCSRTKSTDGRSCQMDRSIKVTSARDLKGKAISMPTAVDGITIESALSVRDVNSCTAACATGDASQCFDLGKTAIEVLGPLSGFVEHVEGSETSPDGTLITKDELIKNFGGDPSQIDDVCERNGIDKDGLTVVNSGLGCELTTSSVFPTSTFKTRLSMKSTVQGYPTAWSEPLRNAGASATQTLFPDLTVAPAIDFVGAGSDQMNPHFAGIIYGIARVADKTIVMATEKGCIKGDYKK